MSSPLRPSSSSSSASSWYSATSSSDNDVVETPVDARRAHIPNLALDNVPGDDNPFVFMHVLNAIVLEGEDTHTAQEKPISLVPELDMNKLVYIAADVCIPRYQLHVVLRPSSATSLPPILESQTCERPPRLPNLAEVLIRSYTPRSQKRDESGPRSTPTFPGKLVVPDEDAGDESFPMYGSHRPVATARSTCKRKRDVEPEENHYPHHAGCSQTPYSPLASPKRARLDACMFNRSYAEVELQALQ